MGKNANGHANYVESLEKENAALKMGLQGIAIYLDIIIYTIEDFRYEAKQIINEIKSNNDSMEKSIKTNRKIKN